MSVNGVSSQTDVWATLAAAGQQTTNPPDGGPIAAAAQVLGMSPDDVVSALQSGQSLADLAQAKGVSHDDLVTAIKTALPQGVTATGKADQIAEKIADRKGMPHHHHGPPPASSDASATGVLSGTLNTDQQSLVSDLAGLLGTTSDDLVGQLQNGTNLSDLLSVKGISTSSLANAIQGSLYIDTTA